MNRILFFLLAVVVVGPVQAQSVDAPAADSTAAADSLLRSLEREMAELAPPVTAAAPTRVRPSTNPDISVIGDARASFESQGPRHLDLGLNEVEFAFKSVVDPFARADFYIAVGEHDGEFEFELEEAYLTTLSLPARLQLKAGKFRSTVGKINRLHPHALPFIDTPRVYERFFGDEGLNDQGASLSWLLPNRRFFQELTLEITNGPGESPIYQAADRDRLLYTSHLKNFWDLTENATLELGFTGVAGPNTVGLTTWIGGVDVTYRWKPLRFNTYRSVLLQAEAFRMSQGARRVRVGNETLAEQTDAWGLYALASYQLSRRWFFTGRFDFVEDPADPALSDQAFSGTFGWHLTEFQKLEIGARTLKITDSDRVYTGLVRLVFVIGTHGAHEY